MEEIQQGAISTYEVKWVSCCHWSFLINGNDVVDDGCLVVNHNLS